MNQNKKQNPKRDMVQNEQKKKATSKQIVAIIGIVLLVLLYIVTLIAAFVDTSASGKLFGMCLFATIAIPLLIWIYTWMYGKLTGKSTIADFNLGGTDNGNDPAGSLPAQKTTQTDADDSQQEI